MSQFSVCVYSLLTWVQYLATAGVMFALAWVSYFSSSPAAQSKKSQKKSKNFKAPVQKSRNPLVYAALLLLAIPSQLPFLQSQVLKHPLSAPYTHPTAPLRILSSTESITGLIVVGEGDPSLNGAAPSLRYLRASHSLLGGVWIGKSVATLDGREPGTDSHGTPIGDSIYSTFVLQEAARMIDSRDAPPLSNALIMYVRSMCLHL